MLARLATLSCAGLIVGLTAASCYQRPGTVGLDCDEDEACSKNESCVEGTCREECESHPDCPDDDVNQLCAAGSCIPCTTSCGNGQCCGEGWECCADGMTCGNWERPCGTDTSAGSAGDTSLDTGDDSGDDSAGDSGGGDEDPDYPRAPCPSGYELASGYEYCAPPCGGGGFCSNGQSGSAEGMCVFNPYSSAGPCTSDVDCPAGETCQTNAGGTMTCLADATHCALFCTVGTCPDSMICLTEAGNICGYG